MTMDMQRVSSFDIFEGGTSVFLEQYTHKQPYSSKIINKIIFVFSLEF